MLSSRIVRITIGSRSVISAARSTLPAVDPPTYATTPSPVFSGITLDRSVLTRSAVAGAEGAVVAITVYTAAFPALLSSGGETSESPLVPINASCSFTRRGSVARSSPPAFVSVFVSSL